LTEHYTTNTESITHWCPRCGRPTQHKVSGGRLAHCLEHEIKGESKKQKAAREKREQEAHNPKLF
jgi:hypothetical protein